MYRTSTLILAISISVFTLFAFSADEIKSPYGFDVLNNIELLPLFKDGIVCLQHSSYDRTGGNDDGFSGTWTHIRHTEAGEFVIFDAEGPGCIYRLWSAQPPEGYVKFFFDGESEPRVNCNFRELFQDKVPPFAAPLTGTSSGGWYSYFPMPFAKRCTIITEKQTGFLAIAYHKFPEGTAIETFSPALSAENKTKLDAVQAHYADPSKKEIDANMQLMWTKIPSADTEFELAQFAGPATILGIHMKVKSELGEKWEDDPTLRKIILRIYFDDDKRPAIESPLGDFFGTGFGDKKPGEGWKPEWLTYSAMTFGMTPDFYYFRLPMPFKKNARITIENGTGREIEIGHAFALKKEPVPENAAYLHVQWREHSTRMGEHVPILQTTGKGHYVGTLLSMQSPHWLTYLEGDEKFYIDGESTPSIYGTGTEDYFNCGWYYSGGPMPKAFHGLTLMRDPQNRTSQYRMHVPDSVPFTKSLKVEIEHGESNNKPYTNYAIVAYWYQNTTSHDLMWKVPPAKELRFPGTLLTNPEEPWLLFEKLYPTLDVEAGMQAGGGKIDLMPLNNLDPNFDGPPQFIVTSDKPGACVRWDFAAPLDDIYSIQLIFIKKQDFGLVELFVDGASTGQKVDFYNETFGRPDIRFEKPVFMTKGLHKIELRIVDKNEKSTGYNMALIAYLIRGASQWAKEWNVVGPFPGGRDFGYGTPYPPEQGIDLAAKYTGVNNKEIAWAQIKTNDILWLHDKIQPANNCVAYVHTYVWSPDDREADALVSTDDAGKLFINTDLVWAVPGVSHLLIDKYTVPVKLRAGWNEILLKVCQGGGHWGFSFRINDPKSELIYSVNKELPETN